LSRIGARTGSVSGLIAVLRLLVPSLSIHCMIKRMNNTN
jgi:hypothetical protein